MRPSAVVGVLGLAAALAACAAPPAANRDAASGEIVVFAASSLRSVFADLAARFEQTRPGTTVRLSFAGSSDLLAALNAGAPADVFAPADETTMARAAEAGLVGPGPALFATNTLTIVTRPGNPLGVAGLSDLTDPAIAVVLCAPRVPCGAATERAERAAGVAINPVSEESAVADVLGKVVSGQADAGLVYLTDARAAGEKVTAVAFAESAAAVNGYPIAVVGDSPNPALAESFIALVTGPQGRQALTRAGFGLP